MYDTTPQRTFAMLDQQMVCTSRHLVTTGPKRNRNEINGRKTESTPTNIANQLRTPGEVLGHFSQDTSMTICTLVHKKSILRNAPASRVH